MKIENRKLLKVFFGIVIVLYLCCMIFIDLGLRLHTQVSAVFLLIFSVWLGMIIEREQNEKRLVG